MYSGCWKSILFQGRIQDFFPGGVRWDTVHKDAAGVSGEGTEGGLGGLPHEKFEYEVL